MLALDDLGDVIDEKGLTFAGATLSTSTTGGVTTVTVTGGNNSGSQAFTFSNAASRLFALANDGNGGTDIVVCFASGTRIRTASQQGGVSERPVEALAIGDLVVTSGGEHRPIRWLGQRTIECGRHPRPHEVMPVRIAAHAFGEDRPMRDLVVSPGHSIAVDLLGEVLIPASALINGSTIVQESAERVTYWHVELESHDVILAEGLPAESYLEMGNRDFFTGGAAVALHGMPDEPGKSHADFCRPFRAEGGMVDVVRERLLARAQTLGWSLVEAPLADLHLLVDGCRMEPVLRGMTASFLLPAAAETVYLVSDTQRPVDLGLSRDARSLGLHVAKLTMQDGFGNGGAVNADDARLLDGFHAVEAGPTRWTAGRARLPETLWEGCEGAFFLRIDFARMPLPRWQRAAVGPMSAQEAA